MHEKFNSKYRIWGYGDSEEEALSELKINIAREDITADDDWMKRRELLHSWCPFPNVLHIDGVTSIIAENGKLTDTVSKESVGIVNEPLSQFITLYKLLHNKVTYLDFIITYAESIDTFFENIAPNVGSMRDFPATKPGVFNNIRCIHYIHRSLFVGEGNDGRLTVTCENNALSVDMPVGVNPHSLIAYCYAKMGHCYTKEVFI